MFEQPLILAIDSGGSKSDFILLTPDGQEQPPRGPNSRWIYERAHSRCR